MRTTRPLQLRAATPADIPALAAIWHDAWHDAHAAHVPAILLPHRVPAVFHALAVEELAQLTVALLDGQLAGFVGVVEDELERLFVARRARGTGAADALIEHGERTIAQHYARAQLVVLEHNARARRFYARHGWIDTGAFQDEAPIPGSSIPITSRRYEKQLR